MERRAVVGGTCVVQKDAPAEFLVAGPIVVGAGFHPARGRGKNPSPTRQRRNGQHHPQARLRQEGAKTRAGSRRHSEASACELLLPAVSCAWR